MTVAVWWVLVWMLLAFGLGWWGHVWVTRPAPGPPPVSIPDEPPAARLDALIDPGRVFCELYDRSGRWVSTQTRVSGTHPPTIERPHGKQPASVYRLQGIVNAVGRYQEIG